MLSIDISFVFIAIIVLILLFALNKVFFRPVKGIIQKRGDIIESNLRNYHEAINKYQKNIEKINQILAEAKREAVKLKEEQLKIGEKKKQEIIEKAKKEGESLIQKAKGKIIKQIEISKRELKKHSKVLADEIIEKILEGK